MSWKPTYLVFTAKENGRLLVLHVNGPCNENFLKSYLCWNFPVYKPWSHIQANELWMHIQSWLLHTMVPLIYMSVYGPFNYLSHVCWWGNTVAFWVYVDGYDYGGRDRILESLTTPAILMCNSMKLSTDKPMREMGNVQQAHAGVAVNVVLVNICFVNVYKGNSSMKINRDRISVLSVAPVRCWSNSLLLPLLTTVSHGVLSNHLWRECWWNKRRCQNEFNSCL